MYIERENVSRKLDSLGRITIPKHLRARLNFTEDQKYELFVIEHEGKIYIAIGEGDEEDK